MATTIKIYDDDVLTHHLVWCRNPEGRFGWYDIFEKKFYDITDEVVARWEKNLVNSHFIDLGISPMELLGGDKE